MKVEHTPEFQAAIIQQEADGVPLPPERAAERERWRQKIADYIARRVVSPMINIDMSNLELTHDDEAVS